jgi:hypothetical protein
MAHLNRPYEWYIFETKCTLQNFQNLFQAKKYEFQEYISFIKSRNIFTKYLDKKIFLKQENIFYTRKSSFKEK